MANFWDNDEVVTKAETAKVTETTPAKGNFWDFDEIVELVDTATTKADPAPVSEDSDRQFYQSGVDLEDRFIEPEIDAADAAPDVEVMEPQENSIDSTTAPLTSMKPRSRPKTQPSNVVTNKVMKPLFNFQNASKLTKPYAEERMNELLNTSYQELTKLFGSDIIINDAIPKVGSRENRPNSRHFHGDAIDISVVGLSDSQKLKLVADAKKAGFTGFGFGNNILHIDMGRNRGWAYGNDLFGGKKVWELIKQIKEN